MLCPQAFDIRRNPLELHFEQREERKDGITRYRFTMKNDGNAPVRPALVRLMQWETGLESLHFFKPGMQKPSDTARFYTAKAGETVPYTNTWRGEWLEAFGDREMLIPSMCCMQFQDGWILAGFSTFEAFEGLIVIRTDAPHILAEAWLETEEILIEPGETAELEELVMIDRPDFNVAMRDYTDLLAEKHGTTPHPAIRGIGGWSDWEFYRLDKNSANIMAGAAALEPMIREGIPVKSIVVDAGWCANIAEWDKRADCVPEGIETLLANIRAKGLLSGLWFAPYIVNTACQVVKDHPEWMLKDKDGKMIHATGSNVGPKCTIDFSVPGALEWLRNILEEFRRIGVQHLKLDGPVLIHYDRGRFHDPRSTRYKQINATLKLIREVCKDMFIESEGVYGPAIGIADCHRVTQDEHPYWIDPSRGISVVKLNSIVNLLAAPWNRRIWSNINMLALRDFPTTHLYYGNERTPETPEGEYLEYLLTENELRVYITSLAISGSTVFFSAPMETVTKSPVLMKRLGRLLPMPEKIWCEPVDTQNDWPAIYRVCGMEREMTAVFNWGEEYADFTVPSGANDVAYEYWDETLLTVTEGSVLLRNVPPRCARLLWFTKKQEITLAGATAHLSGLGIAMTGNTVTCELHDTAEQCVTLLVPAGTRYQAEAELAPYRGGDVLPVPVLADDRIEGVLKLLFRAPVCGRITLTLKGGKGC